MTAPSFPRSARCFAVVMLVLCAVAAPAESLDISADSSRIIVSQDSELNTPPEAPAMDHGHDAPAKVPAIPDPNPKLNKKRAAFWGVTFMLATSVAFAIFGTWAIKKTPKPGQQRPE